MVDSRNDYSQALWMNRKGKLVVSGGVPDTGPSDTYIPVYVFADAFFLNKLRDLLGLSVKGYLLQRDVLPAPTHHLLWQPHLLPECKAFVDVMADLLADTIELSRVSLASQQYPIQLGNGSSKDVKTFIVEESVFRCGRFLRAREMGSPIACRAELNDVPTKTEMLLESYRPVSFRNSNVPILNEERTHFVWEKNER